MNRYTSGYTLCSILSFFGITVIIASTACSFFFFYIYFSSNLSGGAPIAGFGFVTLIFGFFQGITSIGMGAIGRAILDGSTAQQEIVQKIEIITKVAMNNVRPLTSLDVRSHDLMSTTPISSRSDLTSFKPAGDMQAFNDELHLGKNVRYYYEIGEYVVDGYRFFSRGDAIHYIDGSRIPE